MNDADFASLLAKVPDLSAKEVTTLQMRLRAAQSINPGSEPGAAPAGPTPPVDWLFEGICTVLRNRGQLDARPPADMITRVSPRYPAHSARVRRVLGQQTGSLSAAQQAKLGRLCAEVLADEITRWNNGTPVCLQVMLNHAWRVPEALESAFPGYLGAGMLGLVIGAQGSPRRAYR